MSGSSTNSGCLGEGSVSGSAEERQPRSCGGERGKEVNDPPLAPMSSSLCSPSAPKAELLPVPRVQPHLPHAEEAHAAHEDAQHGEATHV